MLWNLYFLSVKVNVGESTPPFFRRVIFPVKYAEPLLKY